MKARDWSRTSLGPVDAWPESLKTPLRLMLASPVPTFIWWGPDLIHLHNDACTRVFGRQRSFGRPAAETREEVWEAIGADVYEVLDSNAARSTQERRVVVARNGRERELFCSFTLTPIRDEWGAAVGVFGTGTDESAAFAARQRLTTLSSLHDEFLAMLAHELRNPLAPIRSAAELLAYVDSNPMSLPHARAIIERQLAQLVRLVDDLLDVSRISRGTLELKRAPLDLRNAIASAVESVTPLIEAARHELDVDMPHTSVPLHGDHVRLTQALANVLTNAAQYTNPGGHIHVAVDTDGGSARIRITDDGIGLDAALLPHVFEMFTQGEQRIGEPRHGLGIGLAVTHRLIELHGGSITAHSAGRDCGSEFVVTLSLSAADAPSLNRHETHPSPRRILVADDNSDAAYAMAEILAAIGHDVRTAEDGLDAIEVAERFRPDLILLDIGMPRLDGYEACRLIRQREWGRDVPIYAVTGWGQASDRRRTREAGFNAHLVKPVSIEAINELIAQAEQ